MGDLTEMLFEQLYLQEILLLTGSMLIFAVCLTCLAPYWKGKRWGMVSSLVWYVVSVLCYTVFCRNMGELTQFQPIPLYNVQQDTNVCYDISCYC